MEIGEDVCIHWTTLYDEILFIHKGTMIVRTSSGELECHPGDIVWLPEGVTLDYDMTGRRCEYFYSLCPIDWAKRNNMEEPSNCVHSQTRFKHGLSLVTKTLNYSNATGIQLSSIRANGYKH